VAGICKHARKIREVKEILVGKCEGNRPLGRPRRSWEDNIKTDLKEIGWVNVDWINLAQDEEQWRCLVNIIMNPWVPQSARIFFD
jgi:hypothetical protein